MTEHDDVIRLLREGRPQATEMELDAIKQRVRRRVADPSRRSQSMKSRVAILGMLVAGMVFSTAGAGLALSGTSHNQASVAQYGETPTPYCTPSGSTQPTDNGSSHCSGPRTGIGDVPPRHTGGGQSPECTPTPEGGVLPAESESGGGESGGGSRPGPPAPLGGGQRAGGREAPPTR